MIDTDTGAIAPGGVPFRAPGAGIINGIGFIGRDVGGDYGQFVVSQLSVEPNVRVEFIGSRAVVVFSVGDVEIAGRVEASGNQI